MGFNNGIDCFAGLGGLDVHQSEHLLVPVPPLQPPGQLPSSGGEDRRPFQPRLEQQSLKCMDSIKQLVGCGSVYVGGYEAGQG